MVFSISLLFAVDAALVWHGVRLHGRAHDQGIPSATRAVGICFAAFLFHAVAAVPLTFACGLSDPIGRAVFLGVFVFFGLFPMVVYARIVIDAIAASASGAIFGMDTARPFARDFSDARSMARNGEIQGAIQAYQAHYDRAPDDPEPLYAIARLLESQGQFEEAAEVLRGILRQFQGNTTQWAKAAYFLCDLLEHELKDHQSANYLLEEIVRRAPKTTYAGFARQDLERNIKPSLN